MTYREVDAPIRDGDTMIFTCCEDCGALVWNTAAHERHHDEIREAIRLIRTAYARR